MGFFSRFFGSATTKSEERVNKVMWQIKGDTLLISGNGEMENYSRSEDIPWHDKRDLIRKAVVTEGITRIGDRAFWGFSNLTEIKLPNTVASIGDLAFQECRNLSSIALPVNVKKIGSQAFHLCEGLKNITIPEGVTSIEALAFGSCNELREITIPSKVKMIEDHTFKLCCGLKKVTLPPNITKIGDSAFLMCESLTSITIPENVTEMGFFAFSGCERLRSVCIPNSVTKIHNALFTACKRLEKIYYPEGRGFEKILSEGNNAELIPYVGAPPAIAKIPLLSDEEKLKWNVDGDILTISGNGEMNDYSYYIKAPWYVKHDSIEKIVVEDGITKIGEWAFEDFTAMTEITIPDSVKEIGGYAFTRCKNLRDVKIPKGVTQIDCGVFWTCESLKKVQIPSSVTEIRYRAFDGCKSLEEITIPDSVTKIGASAFNDCENLTAITIPKNVIDMDMGFLGIFCGCKRLQKIYYPEGRDFEKSLSMNNNAKLIPYNTEPPGIEKLRQKVEGKTLTVGGVREIKDYSCDNPNAIKKIVVEAGVEKISANAFFKCKRLERMIIPASVRTIGDFASTFCFCGDRNINNSKNVIWSLDDGVLKIKKNPAAKSDADFSTGYEMWYIVEKNIRSIEIERGIILNKRFFDWLGRQSGNIQTSYTT